MAWIESHQTLRNHPKTMKAARLARCSRKEVLIDLHYLWWWSLDYAESGDLTRFAHDELEAVMEWEGEPGLLVAALIDAGFLEVTEDHRLLIHDWAEHAGKLIAMREHDRNRKRLAAQKARGADTTTTPTLAAPTEPAMPSVGIRQISSGIPVESAGIPEDSIRNPALTNQPLTNHIAAAAADAASGEDQPPSEVDGSGLFEGVDAPPPAPKRTAEDVKAETAASLARFAARTTAGASQWIDVAPKDARMCEALEAFCVAFRRTPPVESSIRKSWADGMRRCAAEIGYDRLPDLMRQLAGLHDAGASGYDFTITDPHSIVKTLMRMRDEAERPPAAGVPHSADQMPVPPTLTPEQWAARGEAFRQRAADWKKRRAARLGAGEAQGKAEVCP
jgi:hypothetical protein